MSDLMNIPTADTSDHTEKGALLHYWGLHVNFLENTLWKQLHL